MQKMKKLLHLIFFILTFFLSHAQKTYWQQQVNYHIDVKLNDTDNSLTAFEKMQYINNSPDTLFYIWFHLWPNAYKNDRTAFSEQLLKNGSTDFYFSKEEDRGYINQLSFQVNSVAAVLEIDSFEIDIAKLILPRPLPPHSSISITTPFHEKLPYNFSRGGHVGQTYQLTQWFPKPAVYDRKGWHPIPYLDQGEFYSEFGNWEVNITVPDNYIVAASGDLQDRSELEHLKEIGKQKPSSQNNYKLFQQLVTSVEKKERPAPEKLMPPSSKNLKTLTYVLNDAHDFAWFASKLFLVQHDTLQIKDHTIDVLSYYNPWDEEYWRNSLKYMKDAVRFYSKKIGAYPYNNVSAVAGNDAMNSGGMEYPTITLITMTGSQQDLDATLAHEIGHNWFYGILGTNERDHAWMDEGINEFYQQEYENEKYGTNSDMYVSKGRFLEHRVPPNYNEVQIATLEKMRKDQPIDTTSLAFTETNYGLIVYDKTPVWMRQLRHQLGTSGFDSSVKYYYEQWKFKHPYPEDFKHAIEQASGVKIDSLYSRIFTTGPIRKYPQPKSVKPATFFNFTKTDKYNYISFLPAVGYNNYDKFMIGAMVHNYQLPLNRFAFIGSALYATGSNRLNGFGRLSFNTFQRRYWLETSVSAATFSFDSYADEKNGPVYLRVQKMVPSVKLVLYNKDLRSTQRTILQARTFLLNEDELLFKTVTYPQDTFDVVTTEPVHSYINQLNVTLLDCRVLYPYSANLTVDQGKQFIRAGFTGKYFFNYSDNNDGLNIRFFAGKFFYLESKTSISAFETDRYHLTLTGPRGYEDYTYSNYFVGRSEFEGLKSQQLMARDGFFKVGTDLLNEKIGKTDDWLMALNFAADIPKLHGVSLLPFKLPIKIFADIGTYSDAWQDNTSARFLYDAGIQVSILRSFVNVYVPILYSKVYSDYFKSTLGDSYFWKTIAFDINLDFFKINNLSNKIPL
ncbi:MAG TPA: M1 family metallopeptidase [Parafilimonas sp.]|nr:M1 family metallopeptidase [Parafilimonas sp.]